MPSWLGNYVWLVSIPGQPRGAPPPARDPSPAMPGGKGCAMNAGNDNQAKRSETMASRVHFAEQVSPFSKRGVVEVYC